MGMLKLVTALSMVVLANAMSPKFRVGDRVTIVTTRGRRFKPLYGEVGIVKTVYPNKPGIQYKLVSQDSKLDARFSKKLFKEKHLEQEAGSTKNIKLVGQADYWRSRQAAGS